jgi:endo-1,4-beta-xylanase
MKKPLLFRSRIMIQSQGIMRSVLSVLSLSSLLLASCSKDEINTENPIPQNNGSANSVSAGKLGDKFYANGTGYDDFSYFWTIDKDGPMGSAYLSFDGAGVKTPTNNLFPGNFFMSWSGVKQVVGGKGWNAGSTRAINYNVGSVTGPVKFVGVYGWTKTPLTEYYVAEMGPGPLYYKGKVGTGTTTAQYTADGNTYFLSKNQRINMPSIIGTATFWQFESLRSNGQVATQAKVGVNGTINMATHFTKWQQLLNTTTNPALNIFGTNIGGGYMVFGCEAYDYSTTTASVSGSLNATIW